MSDARGLTTRGSGIARRQVAPSPALARRPTHEPDRVLFARWAQERDPAERLGEPPERVLEARTAMHAHFATSPS